MKKSLSLAASGGALGEIVQNIIIGLTVSFVALSLGAALGMLSGRGAFAGMISAGVIALVTSTFGGTRVQCSGPTAPMSAVSAVTVAYAFEHVGTATLGGIPGAQATIRSVLMIKEGATLRLAGIMVGVFVLIEMVLFQGLISLIPKAVFVGVLIKVGYDVFDFLPIRLYAKEVARKRAAMFKSFFSRHDDEPIFVTNREMLMIIGASVVTVLFDLNTAVAGFTLLFYLHNKVFNRKNPMRDLKPIEETEAFVTQN